MAGEAPAADVADRELDGEDLDAAGVGPATEGAERDSTAVRDTAEGAALGDPDFAPVVNVTEASAIDFDDEEVSLSLNIVRNTQSLQLRGGIYCFGLSVSFPELILAADISPCSGLHCMLLPPGAICAAAAAPTAHQVLL